MDTLTDVNNRLGGVHQVVDENNFIVYCLHHFRLVFDGKSIKNDFKYLSDI